MLFELTENNSEELLIDTEYPPKSEIGQNLENFMLAMLNEA